MPTTGSVARKPTIFALLAALLAALSLAAPAGAQVPSALPVGWGGDESVPAEAPGQDDAGPDWIDPGDLLPGGAEEPEPQPDLLPPPGRRPVVKGRLAALGADGIAYAPSKAPHHVKLAVWAANELRRKPYRWGGGHRQWQDSGYDCSGAVSYVLHAAGMLGTPLDSRGFMRYGRPGVGRWISIYANKGHVFMVVAGLRFDTSPLGVGPRGPRWRSFGRRAGGFKVRHPAGA